jgi:hypothetical protein
MEDDGGGVVMVEVKMEGKRGRFGDGEERLEMECNRGV